MLKHWVCRQFCDIYCVKVPPSGQTLTAVQLLSINFEKYFTSKEKIILYHYRFNKFLCALMFKNKFTIVVEWDNV